MDTNLPALLTTKETSSRNLWPARKTLLVAQNCSKILLRTVWMLFQNCLNSSSNDLGFERWCRWALE